MNDWLKVILPVFLTAIGALIFGLFNQVADIKRVQLDSQVWTYRIEQNELEIKKLQGKYVPEQ